LVTLRYVVSVKDGQDHQLLVMLKIKIILSKKFDLKNQRSGSPKPCDLEDSLNNHENPFNLLLQVLYNDNVIQEQNPFSLKSMIKIISFYDLDLDL